MQPHGLLQITELRVQLHVKITFFSFGFLKNLQSFYFVIVGYCMWIDGQKWAIFPF